MDNWIRVLKVIFTENLGGGKGRQIVYGDNWPKPDLEISVTINKFAASMKDVAIINITNMPYSEVIKITKNKMYNVQVIAGYRNGNENIVFDGAVARINNTFISDRSNRMLIFCTSKFIARYCQSMLNYTLTSGMNTYSAIKFMCARAGLSIENCCVSTQLKKQIIEEAESSINQSLSSFMTTLVKNNPSYIINTDGMTGSVMSIFDAAKSNSRVVKIKDSQLLSYPQLSSDGLDVTVLPTFNFQCGDTIEVNNALINLEKVQTLSNISNQPGIYLDTSGKLDTVSGDSYGLYMILQISYDLHNRGNEFSCNLLAKARSLISNYVGA